MAQQMVLVLTDDLDGSEAAETMSYSWDGNNYVIDLNEAHAAEFRSAVEPFLKASRKAGRTQPRKAASASASKGELSPGAVRAWAREQGLEVNERGRIQSSILEQYKAAH